MNYPKPIDPNINLNIKRNSTLDHAYFATEEFNALRKELYEQWPQHWAKIGGAMVHDPVAFVEYMSNVCGLLWTGFDSFAEGEHCLRILNALRAKRGLSAL